MEWASIIGGIISALLVAIGLPLALRSRKGGSQKKVEELCQHLQGIGVNASLVERGVEEEKVGVSRARSQRSEGVIEIRGKEYRLYKCYQYNQPVWSPLLS